MGFPHKMSLAVMAAGLVLAHFTKFGRAVHAIGDDEEAATLLGIPVARTRVLVYTLAGTTSALAGLVTRGSSARYSMSIRMPPGTSASNIASPISKG